jgi:hypothetical protein
MELSSSVATAVSNMAAFGDTDIFPAPLEQELFRDCPAWMADALMDLHLRFDELSKSNPPEALRSLVPVGQHGFRLATQLDPVWNAYFLALTLALAPAVEQIRPASVLECVFSYRHCISGVAGRIFDPNVSWAAFTQRTRRLCEENNYCVTADITEFYHRITVEMVAEAVSGLNAPRTVCDRLIAVLRVLGVDSHGLPVGGPASRIIAELVLAKVDARLLDAGVKYCRFVDDFRIFSASEEEARALLLRVARMIYDAGFSFQKHKTRIVTTTELEDELQVAEMLDFAGAGESNSKPVARNQRLVLLQHDPYSELKVSNNIRVEEFASRPDALEVIRREFTKRRLNVSLAKQVLGALNFLSPELLAAAVKTILADDSLRSIAPVFSRALQLILENVFRLSLEMRDCLVERIEWLLAGDDYLFQIELHCVLALRVVRAAIREGTGFDSAVLERMFRRSGNSLLRREVLILMAVLRDFQRVTELVRTNASMSGWDGRTLQLLRSMPGFDCSAVPDILNAGDPCASVLGRWLSGEREGA